MKDWLEPVKRLLAIERNNPATIFFRDDDAGWSDDRLFQLLEIFSSHSIPIDLAVIPKALGVPLANRLRDHREKFPKYLGLHQHGFCHDNHELEGRKCEFGPIRSQVEQFHDIQKGKQHLEELLGGMIDPIFTPPWNRCNAVTAKCLKFLEFKVLSRDVTADPILLQGLREVPVHIDWFRKRKGIRIILDQLGQEIADAIQSRDPVGIMLHHEPMSAEDFQALDHLLALFAGSKNIRCLLMRDLFYKF